MIQGRRLPTGQLDAKRLAALADGLEEAGSRDAGLPWPALRLVAVAGPGHACRRGPGAVSCNEPFVPAALALTASDLRPAFAAP